MMNFASEVGLALDSKGKDPYLGMFKVNLQALLHEHLKALGM